MHPFEAAVFAAWCRERGLDPDRLRRQMAGKEMVSRSLAEVALRDLGVPLDAWPLLEPDWNLSTKLRDEFRLRIASLTSSRDDTNLNSFHVEPTNSENRHTRKRKPQTTAARLAIGKGNATSTTLFRAWLDANGWSATSWAGAHPRDDGTTPRWAPSSVRAWQLPADVEGARAIPEEAALLIAIESEGAVPATDESWPSGISRPRRHA